MAINLANYKKDEIIKMNGWKCSHGHCLAKHTLILTKNLDWKPIYQIKKGDIVFGFRSTRASFKLVNSKVIAIEKSKRNIRILYDKFEITPEHKVMVYSKRGSKYQLRYTPAECLGGKTTLEIPVKYKSVNWKDGYLFGFFLSDGNFSTRGITFNNTNTNLIENIINYSDVVLPKKINKIRKQSSLSDGGKSVYRASVYSVDIERKYKSLCTDIENCNYGVFENEFLRGFIAGFYDGDGSQSKSTIYFYNTNIKYIKFISYILKQFGFKPQEIYEDKRKNKSLYNIRVADRTKFWFTFTPNKYLEKYGLHINTAVLDKYTFEESPIIKDYRLFENEENDVYDIQTETGNFIANGILVHNSGIEHPQCYLREHNNDLKRCFFDIETNGLNANYSFMLTYSIKPEGSDNIIYGSVTKKEIDSGIFDKRIVKECINALLKFDRIYTYYGTKFDIPFLRTRALEMGIDFPIYGTLTHKDVYYIARYKLKLHSNRLEVLCDLLGIKGKTHANPTTWRLATGGNKKALDEILEHNRQDVIILENAYHKLKDFTKETERSI